MQAKRSNRARSSATRAALLEAARDLFLSQGYAAAATPEVVARAGVTRGALYHHFRDKEALYLAVVEAEAEAVAREIEAGAMAAQDPLHALSAGARAYFDAMTVPGRVRLLLLEGPAVLGPEAMRDIDLRTGGLELREGLRAALGPTTDPTAVAIRADLVSAMFDRAALACEAGADRHGYAKALDELLALLVQGPPPQPA